MSYYDVLLTLLIPEVSFYYVFLTHATSDVLVYDVFCNMCYQKHMRLHDVFLRSNDFIDVCGGHFKTHMFSHRGNPAEPDAAPTAGDEYSSISKSEP